MSLDKVSRILTRSNSKTVLVKIERQGICYVKSCLVHGSETWPMKAEHELKLNYTEVSMVKWM